jgi:hypothetical protein
MCHHIEPLITKRAFACSSESRSSAISTFRNGHHVRVGPRIFHHREAASSAARCTLRFLEVPHSSYTGPTTVTCSGTTAVRSWLGWRAAPDKPFMVTPQSSARRHFVAPLSVRRRARPRTHRCIHRSSYVMRATYTVNAPLPHARSRRRNVHQHGGLPGYAKLVRRPRQPSVWCSASSLRGGHGDTREWASATQAIEASCTAVCGSKASYQSTGLTHSGRSKILPAAGSGGGLVWLLFSGVVR